MATIKIETTKAYAKELLKKLNEDKKIKTAYLSEPEAAYQQKLTSADWALPGRPATEEEIEEFVNLRDKEKGGRPFSEFKEEMLNKMKVWKEQKEKL